MNKIALKILSQLKGQNPEIDAAIELVESLKEPHRLPLTGGSRRDFRFDAGIPSSISVYTKDGPNQVHYGTMTMKDAQNLRDFLDVVLTANKAPNPEPDTETR